MSATVPAAPAAGETTPAAPEDPWGGHRSPLSLVNLVVSLAAGALVLLILGRLGGAPRAQTGEPQLDARRNADQGGWEPIWRDPQPLAPEGGWITAPVDGARMRCFPAGEAMLGRDEGPADCRPAHRVQLAAYAIDAQPVSVARYARFLAGVAAEHRHPLQPPSKQGHLPDRWEAQQRYPERPVTGVDWFDAYAYAAWAGLRLPTEAEWERAARGPEGRVYPWGDAPPGPARCAFGLLDPAALPPAGDSHPAGGTPAGVLALAGHVWEWCYDVYQPGAYRLRGGAAADPRGPANGARRAVRGGSFRSAAAALLAAHRAARAPLARADDLGFRCARTLP